MGQYVEHKSYMLQPQEVSLSILCGDPWIQHWITTNLCRQGVRIEKNTTLKLIIDFGQGYALQQLENVDRPTGTQYIIITWNRCPEYIEDLLELEPEGLISGDFYLRQDPLHILLEIVTHIQRGEHYIYMPGTRSTLTYTERTVLRYVARGWENKQICDHLYMAEQTIKNSLRAIYRKIGAENRTQAALYYWQLWQFENQIRIIPFKNR